MLVINLMLFLFFFEQKINVVLHLIIAYYSFSAYPTLHSYAFTPYNAGSYNIITSPKFSLTYNMI